MVNAVRSPTLRACIFSAFVVFGTGMDVFPPELMGAPVFDHVTSCASDAHKQDGVTLDMDLIWIDTRIDNHRTEHARVVATLPM